MKIQVLYESTYLIYILLVDENNIGAPKIQNNFGLFTLVPLKLLLLIFKLLFWYHFVALDKTI